MGQHPARRIVNPGHTLLPHPIWNQPRDLRPLAPALSPHPALERNQADRPAVPPPIFENRTLMTLKVCSHPGPRPRSWQTPARFRRLFALTHRPQVMAPNRREPSHLFAIHRKHAPCAFHSFRSKSRHPSRYNRRCPLHSGLGRHPGGTGGGPASQAGRRGATLQRRARVSPEAVIAPYPALPARCIPSLSPGRWSELVPPPIRSPRHGPRAATLGGRQR